MGWMEANRMSLRSEFVHLLKCGGVSFAELCRRFGISRKTGYKWAARAREDESEGEVPMADRAALWSADRSRRPRSCPWRTSPEMEKAIVSVRREHPAWGARKIARVLQDRGVTGIPSVSTITEVLRRHQLIGEEESKKHRPCTRFERENPNELWQMDFKGHFALEGGSRCHPLVVVDDCSRYLLALDAHGFEREEVVRSTLKTVFRTHGLPFAMLMDNGSVWGSRDVPTRLAVWLMRLMIRVRHGRIYHPQTQGKCERLNRSLKAEVLAEGARFASLASCQVAFDRFRICYNNERPHEALGMAVPATRYRPSAIAYPEQLPVVEYMADDIVRRVGSGGAASMASGHYHIGRGFTGEQIAFRPTGQDGVFDVYYCQSFLKRVDARRPDFKKYEKQEKQSPKTATTADKRSR